MKKVKLSVIMVAFTMVAAGQDFHLSQYGGVPQYMNPALTGLYINNAAKCQVYSAYRSQWNSLSIKPYSTMAISADMPVDKDLERFGAGFLLINNKSGIGGFKTLSLLLSGAYRITNAGSVPHHLAVGLQAGIFFKNFDPSSFTFDSQYSSSAPGGFDTNIPSGENFGKTGLARFDAGMGIYYKYIEKERSLHPYLGVSVFHVTRPNESFTTQKSKLPMRFVVHGGLDYDVNKQLTLKPSMKYMNQNRAYDLNSLFSATYLVGEGPYTVGFGIGYRMSDAMIYQLEIVKDSYQLRISYDYNTSFLQHYSNGRGAWELSILIGITKSPDFMRKWAG